MKEAWVVQNKDDGLWWRDVPRGQRYTRTIPHPGWNEDLQVARLFSSRAAAKNSRGYKGSYKLQVQGPPERYQSYGGSWRLRRPVDVWLKHTEESSPTRVVKVNVRVEVAEGQ